MKKSKDEQRRKNHQRCQFCGWKENWEKFSQDEGYRLVEGSPSKGYFVILSKNPKMAGHTLVISIDPYDDITDKENENFKPQFPKENVLTAVVQMSQKLKEKLRAEKVYVATMCDHYEPEEIKDPEKRTTEHLHFHLLPRYRDGTKGWSLFCLPDKKGEDLEASPALLEIIKNRICN